MMKFGLLWYDADPKRPLEFKMSDAAERYLQKFGVRPNACHVNPSDTTRHPWLAVIPNKAIRRSHFWLGVDDEVEEPAKPAAPETPAAKRESKQAAAARPRPTTPLPLPAAARRNTTAPAARLSKTAPPPEEEPKVVASTRTARAKVVAAQPATQTKTIPVRDSAKPKTLPPPALPTPTMPASRPAPETMPANVKAKKTAGAGSLPAVPARPRPRRASRQL